MTPLRRLSRLTDGDFQIIEKTRETRNLNWFTNYYLRSLDSGTYFRPVYPEVINNFRVPAFKEKAEKWARDYDTLYAIWYSMGKPSMFGCVNPVIGASAKSDWFEFKTEESLRESGYEHRYRVTHDPKYSEPVFHNPHGFQFLPWQLDMDTARQFMRVVIGGYGSGKTLGAAASLLYYGSTLKKFKALVLAPNADQVKDIYDALDRLTTDTLFREKFWVHNFARPRYTIQLGHKGVGINEIVFIPVGDEPEKVNTITNIDIVLVDQAESIGDLNTLIEAAGTRQRGQEGGREKMGIMNLLANSGESPELWEKYDDGEIKPNDVWAKSPSSSDNIYLTVSDMIRYERVIGATDDAVQQAIFGAKPKGKSEIFTGVMLDNLRAPWLDARTDAIKLTGPHVGTYKWYLPPILGHKYLVAADPGQDNPPRRNSPVIGVWDMTNFPQEAAQLVGFEWIAANGSSEAWMLKYIENIVKYRAIGSNAFDGTGLQSAYAKPVTGLADYAPFPVNFGGVHKLTLINLAQLMMNLGLLKAPYIEHMWAQLARYKLPDEKLVQDIVAMILVSVAWLERLFYRALDQPRKPNPDAQIEATDRWYRPPEDRWDTQDEDRNWWPDERVPL